MQQFQPQLLSHNLPISLQQQLQDLRKKLVLIPDCFQMFKEQIIGRVREWLGRISSLVYRQTKEKMMLQYELQKSKQVQQTMRNEVIQLKEMINEAMVGYSRDLQSKNNEIRRLTALLQNLDKESQLAINQEIEKNTNDLEIIQQQSEQATFSTVNTLRESQEEEKASQKQQHSVYLEEHSPIKQNKLSPVLDKPQSLTVIDQARNSKESKNEPKRTKSFIDNFRKTIEQSLQNKQQESVKQFSKNQSESSEIQNIIQNAEFIAVKNLKFFKPITQMLPIQQITNTALPLQNKIYVNCPQYSTKQAELLSIKPKITFNFGQSHEISSISNSSQLTKGQQEQNGDNLQMRSIQTPSNQSVFKKKDREQSRIMTEPSPQRIRPSHNYFSNKPSQTPSHLKKSVQRAYSLQEKKSMKTSISKQKIKVTSRMVEEMSHPRRNPSINSSKAFVYLGGKSLFRKFLLQLKQAFKKYIIFGGLREDEVKYEGQKRNKMRWGRGRLFYRNGMVYQGEFKDNMRHGRGSLYLNGISMYEGQWNKDKIQGQGYLKSMKYMAKECPSILNEASFCGNLFDSRLNGIGTIFLNPKQKIVTKFVGGIPTGQLTYYNLQEIEFGVWPSQ